MDLANLLDSDGNMQNEMMVMAFAATMLATIPGLKFTFSLKLKLYLLICIRLKIHF
jgi:hypothetical protein